MSGFPELTEEQIAERLRPLLKDSAHDPAHYKGAVECIAAIKASLSPVGYRGYLKGNIMKYLWRYEKKGGVQDLEKARVYLNWLIDDNTPSND
jgi:hypothetical protein